MDPDDGFDPDLAASYLAAILSPGFSVGDDGDAGSWWRKRAKAQAGPGSHTPDRGGGGDPSPSLRVSREDKPLGAGLQSGSPAMGASSSLHTSYASQTSGGGGLNSSRTDPDQSRAMRSPPKPQSPPLSTSAFAPVTGAPGVARESVVRPLGRPMAPVPGAVSSRPGSGTEGEPPRDQVPGVSSVASQPTAPAALYSPVKWPAAVRRQPGSRGSLSQKKPVQTSQSAVGVLGGNTRAPGPRPPVSELTDVDDLQREVIRAQLEVESLQSSVKASQAQQQQDEAAAQQQWEIERAHIQRQLQKKARLLKKKQNAVCESELLVQVCLGED